VIEDLKLLYTLPGLVRGAPRPHLDGRSVHPYRVSAELAQRPFLIAFGSIASNQVARETMAVCRRVSS
jgi:hypothetical protein